VASADLTNHDLLIALADTHKPLLCSTGMSQEWEIRESVALLKARGAPFCWPAPIEWSGFSLIHCRPFGLV